MKKFTVKPRLSPSEQLVGTADTVPASWVYLGRLGEAGPIMPIKYDLAHAHVMAVFGKRGSGKSYTLGSFLEGLCTCESKTSIGYNSRRWGVLLFDDDPPARVHWQADTRKRYLDEKPRRERADSDFAASVRDG